MFRIVALQVPQGLDVFLHMVGQIDFCLLLGAGEMVLHPFRRQHDEERDGNRPYGGQRHTPLEEAEPDREDHGRDHAAIELGNHMGSGVFHRLRVGHDGACQVREVFLGEEGKGEFAEFLRKRDSSCGRFRVCGTIGGIVLPYARRCNQCQAYSDTADVHPYTGEEPYALQAVSGEQVQQRYRGHQSHVLHHHRGDGGDHVLGTLVGQCECFLEIAGHTASPTFQSTAL